MIALSKQTSGEDFLKQVTEAGTRKGALFALLHETLQTEYPKLHLSTVINQLKNFDALRTLLKLLKKLKILRF